MAYPNDGHQTKKRQYTVRQANIFKYNSAMTDQDFTPYLQPTSYVDSDHDAVIGYARDHAGDASNDTEQALNFYFAIRDGIRYDPYLAPVDPANYRASDAVKNGVGWCVPKAALLAACCRIHDIPARPGYADVKNHMATQRLLDLLGTDMFIWHSYCEIYLDGTWVKATPAFNKSLCKRFGLKPLEWDGKTDSLFHEFDVHGNRHMEYVQDRGAFADVPFETILADFKALYRPEYVSGAGGDFHAEAGAAQI